MILKIAGAIVVLQLLGAAVQVAGDSIADAAPAREVHTINFQLDDDLKKKNGAKHAKMLMEVREFAAPQIYYGAPLCCCAGLRTRGCACAQQHASCRTHVPWMVSCAKYCRQHMRVACNLGMKAESF